MSSTTENVLEQAYQVALYRNVKYGWVMVSQFQGEDDTKYRTDHVRISEPVEVRFEPLTGDECIQQAFKTLDAAELKVRLEFEKALNEIRDQRASLLALTHQPEVPA